MADISLLILVTNLASINYIIYVFTYWFVLIVVGEVFWAYMLLFLCNVYISQHCQSTWLPHSLNGESNRLLSSHSAWLFSHKKLCWIVVDKSHENLKYLLHVHLTFTNVLQVIACVQFGAVLIWLHLFWKENDRCYEMKAPRHLTVHTNPSLRVNTHPTNPTANVSRRVSDSAVLPISTHTWQA